MSTLCFWEGLSDRYRSAVQLPFKGMSFPKFFLEKDVTSLKLNLYDKVVLKSKVSNKMNTIRIFVIKSSKLTLHMAYYKCNTETLVSYVFTYVYIHGIGIR